MSTPASPLHHSAPSGRPDQAAFAWKDELNARLREHRQRREDMRLTAAPATPSRAYPSGEESAAARVAARVAARYRNAPTYSELLAASAEAAAVAAETAAAAAREAHVAAQAALQGWEDEQAMAESPRSLSGHDVFTDPFFTESRRAVEDSPRARWEETALPSAAYTPPPAAEPADAPAMTVSHHAPLPERIAVPERQPVVARARALVDAFADALVPAAQQLPAKLIEFPRELIAAHKQRPRLAEGPLFEPEQAVASLRIFEVEQEAAPVSPEAHHRGSMNGEAPASADGSVATALADPLFDFDGEMGKQSVDDSFEEAPRRHGGFLFEEDAARTTPASSSAQAPEPPAPSRPRTTPMERASSSDEVAPLWKARSSKLEREAESGWSSIRLGEHPRAEVAEVATPAPMRESRPELKAETRRQAAKAQENAYQPAAAAAEATSLATFEAIAPISDRCMAAIVDAGVVFGSFLLGVLVFASCTVHPPAGKAAMAVGVLVLAIMGAFYGWLFMTYGGGSTPGMRYARIALCTFDDANPTRKELQNRIPATALALLPVGLGILWALFDEDRLGWHDRMTRTYQRAYR